MPAGQEDSQVLYSIPFLTEEGRSRCHQHPWLYNWQASASLVTRPALPGGTVSEQSRTLVLHQPGWLLGPYRPRCPLRRKPWLVLVGNGVLPLFTTEIKDWSCGDHQGQDSSKGRRNQRPSSLTSTIPFLLSPYLSCVGVRRLLSAAGAKACLEGQRVCGRALWEPNR